MINYYLLTKPGIIFGNLVTVAAGFFLASKGLFHLQLFIMTLISLSLIIASACVFNNYIDKEIDKKMERTNKRPLVTGVISTKAALFFGAVLLVLGNILMFSYTNVLTVFLSNLGFIIYIFPYSMWKSKTEYNTAIGSIAGALPPVIGYTSVTNQFDLAAAILFCMLVLWQMPHFFSIATYRLDDYKKANVAVLPVLKGLYKTKIHILIYIALFILMASLLTIFNFTGYYYLATVLSIGSLWFVYALNGFKNIDSELWGKRMFQISLVLIISLSILIPLDVK